jgi:hypothetical protein
VRAAAAYLIVSGHLSPRIATAVATAAAAGQLKKERAVPQGPQVSYYLISYV